MYIYLFFIYIYMYIYIYILFFIQNQNVKRIVSCISSPRCAYACVRSVREWLVRCSVTSL